MQDELNELRFEYRVKDELFRQARKQIGQLTDDRDQFMSMIGGFQLKLRQLGVANDEILQLTSPQSGEPARPGQGTEADFVPEQPNPTNPQSSPEASSDQLL